MTNESQDTLQITHLRGALALLEQVARLEEQVDSLIREGGVSGHLPLVGDVMTSISNCAQMLVEDFARNKQPNRPPGDALQHQDIEKRMVRILQDISTGMERVKRKINGSLSEGKSGKESIPLN